jgi:hypothetical protein
MPTKDQQAEVLLILQYIDEATERRQMEEQRIAHENFQHAAWIKLNNLYLSIQRGTRKLSITTANELRVLVGDAYDADETIMQDFWAREFTKLPHWFEF